jgi:putative acetyltransferase
VTLSAINVRVETVADFKAIYDVTKLAFATMPFAGGDEQDLVNALRDAGALTLSLVAEQDGVVIGHIAFSPSSTQSGEAGWYGLGPVSVDPKHQRQGVGRLLIQDGLARLKALGARGCILTGNPAYYERFGFVLCPQLAPPREPAPYFMVLPLTETAPDAVFAFHPAFYGEA